MKALLPLAALALLAACATTPVGAMGPRNDWSCQGGSAFSSRIKENGSAEVFAGGQVYTLPHVEAASGARYSNGNVEYWERGGSATLNGAQGGPYTNCRR
jgi:membrane-bound inhibitor of C-type lysozyme